MNNATKKTATPMKNNPGFATWDSGKAVDGSRTVEVLDLVNQRKAILHYCCQEGDWEGVNGIYTTLASAKRAAVKALLKARG